MPKTLFNALSWQKLLFNFLFLSLLLFSSGCEKPTNNRTTQASFYVFGTQVNVIIYQASKEQAEQAIHQVEKRFQQFHQEWHAWQKGGIVNQINQAIAQQKSITLEPSVIDFIKKSQQLSQQSLGLFDPGIGQLISLWGFHSETWQGPPPEKSEILAWLKNRPSINDITFDNNQLSSSSPNVQLDFGGNAKGLAIDIALDSLEKFGIKNALVSIGGDMKVIGSKKPLNANSAQTDLAWSIAIQNPINPNEAFAQLPLYNGESIVTSGTYQRFFEWQGKRYSHIINPNTGYPANSFASVTVIHDDATTADAAATALLIAGPKEWQKIAKNMALNYVFTIDQLGNIQQTKAMKERIKLL